MKQSFVYDYSKKTELLCLEQEMVCNRQKWNWVFLTCEYLESYMFNSMLEKQESYVERISRNVHEYF